MSSHVWRIVYQTIREVERQTPRTMRRCQYSDTLIVAMYTWTVMHDRPMCWAADRSHYYGPFRPRRLPSRSQFCRRIASPRCDAILQEVDRRLAGRPDGPTICLMDGRPLVVGACSQDRDARAGRICYGFAKGYRMHAIAAKSGEILAWRVTPLNVSEKHVAFELVEEASPQGVLVADGNYDIGKLYDHVFANGALLFTPLPKNVGGGHRPQSRSRMLAAWMWAHGGAELYKERTAIERIFSQQSTYGGGLAPLPAWVRSLARVRRWVRVKLMFYHARLRIRKAAA